MPLAKLAAMKGKRVLLLQGPLGPFFARFAELLTERGAHVEKVNFNGGDWLFYPNAEHAFRAPMGEWPAYFERLLRAERYDLVFLFGDCRPIHRAAREVASRLGVEVGVFEEGYLRPNYITLERGGVNDHSPLPRSPEHYRARGIGEVPVASPLGPTFGLMAFWAFSYYLAAIVLRRLYPHYEHHRPFGAGEAIPWLKSVVRKHLYARREAGIEERLVRDHAERYFLVPLQVHNDAQVTVHSGYGAVEPFVREVIASFAAHAPADTLLVLKHHPLDRAYNDYTAVIASVAAKAGVGERVLYIHDQHLPTLLEHARGAVVINSTVGLQALDHRTPLKVCGRALYDMAGLTYQGSLDSFWRAAQSFRVEEPLLVAFKRTLVLETQLGGSFYRTLPSGEALEVLGTNHVESMPQPAPANVAAAAE